MISVELTAKIISRLAALSEASAQIEEIKVRQKSGNIHSYHTCLNLYFFSQFCSVKSTIAQEIAEATGTKVLTDSTKASLMGTIDKETKVSVKSPLWELRGKIIMFDEFNFRDSQGVAVKTMLLQITEGQGKINRSIAIPASKDIDEKDGNMYLRIKKGAGMIEMKVRVAAVFFSMIEPIPGAVVDDALFSRCVMFQYHISESQEDQIMDGETLLKMKKIKVKKKKVLITTKEYKKIREYVDEYIGGRSPKGIRLRIVADCCKVYAALGRHSETDYRLITELKLSNGILLTEKVEDGVLGVDNEALNRLVKIDKGLTKILRWKK